MEKSLIFADELKNKSDPECRDGSWKLIETTQSLNFGRER